MSQAGNPVSLKDGVNKFLAIQVGEHGFAVPIESVREIVYYTKINPLPQTPEFVRGVALIRQETIPVLDLNILLGSSSETPIHNESCFIVIQLSDGSGKLTQVCLLADRILQTYKMELADIDPAPVLKDENIVQYVMGIGRVEDDIYILIDPASLISPYVESVSEYANYIDDMQTDVIEGQHQDEQSNNVTSKKNKFLSVYVGDDEYAFPMSGVSQIVGRYEITGLDDEDMPEFLDGAAIYDDKPLAIVHLSKFVSEDDWVKHKHEEAGKQEVVILVEFGSGLLGVIVDRIGHTYETDKELKQHSFCNDLARDRINSLGFIDRENDSIEVIEPSGVLTESERAQIISWMGCIERMVDMTDRIQDVEETDKDTNPLAIYSGSYLVVQVGKEMIALQSIVVDEVLSYDNLIPLRNGPDWFMGLLDLRQRTYPVIDLHQRLDIDYDPAEQNRNVLVMIKDKDEQVGLYVDRIVKSSHITSSQIQGCENSRLVVNPGVLHAVADIDVGLVHIVNLQEVIGKEEISARRLVDELNKQNGIEKDIVATGV